MKLLLLSNNLAFEVGEGVRELRYIEWSAGLLPTYDLVIFVNFPSSFRVVCVRTCDA